MGIVEIMRGSLIKHDFFASKTQNSLADIHDESNLIYIYGNPHGLRLAMSNKRNLVMRENET